MKKLFVLAILVLVGAVGYAFWQESKMVVTEDIWPKRDIVLEFEGSPGEVRPYKLEGDLNMKTQLPGNPVVDATFVIHFTEAIGSPLPEGAFEVTYTCRINPQQDIVVKDRLRELFFRIGMGRQLAEMGGVVIKGIRYRNGLFEMTDGPSGIEGNFLLQALFDQHFTPPNPVNDKAPPWDRQLDLVAVSSTMPGYAKVNGHRCAKIDSKLNPVRRQVAPGTASLPQLSGSMTTYFDYGMGIVAEQTGQQTLKGGGQNLTFNYTLSLDEPRVEAEVEAEAK